MDSALEGSAQGIRALLLSLLILGGTAVLQLVVAWISGSAGLLADTIHNFADALTAVPLGIAFTLSRRPPNRRFTYGYDRAEDVAGVMEGSCGGENGTLRASGCAQSSHSGARSADSKFACPNCRGI